jgi:hypothetical protein
MTCLGFLAVLMIKLSVFGIGSQEIVLQFSLDIIIMYSYPFLEKEVDDDR